jgi:hypothetical protein
MILPEPNPKIAEKKYTRGKLWVKEIGSQVP